MNIRPLSNLTAADFAAGGTYEPTAANFPALKHFFPLNDATQAYAGTNLTISDAVGNIVIGQATPTTGTLTNNADGSLTSNNAMTTLVGGAWAVPNFKCIVLFFMGKATTANRGVVVGSVTAATNKGFRVHPNAATVPEIVGNGEIVTATAQTSGDSTPAIYVQTFMPGIDNGIKGYNFNGTTYNAIAGSGNFTEASWTTGLTEIDAAVNMGCLLDGAYMAGVLHFTNEPSDIRAAMTWMYNQAITSPYNKLIYPGWKGLS